MNAILGFFARLISYPLIWIYQLVNNYGLSIILLTVFIRLCILPLYSKQIKYSAEMADLQPKIKEIQTKYARDRELQNQKMQELYAQENINPASGCLPMLIQLPVIMGLYQLLRTPLLYITDNFMISAVHESFFWIPDLSQPDTWILPILAGLTTYFTYVATSVNTPNETAGMMNAMKFIFPIMIFVMGRSFSAGLALYWFIGNVFTIIQTLFLNKKREKLKRKNSAMEEAKKNIRKEAAN